MNFFLRQLALFSILCCCEICSAAPHLPRVFSDNMVLQREEPVPVWGWADSGEKVTVAFAGQEKTATADQDGRWKVVLDPLAKSSTPGVLAVRGSGQVLIQNVLVGEVWLCSGQSNMEWSVAGSKNAPEEIAKANYPNIRHFKVDHRVAQTPQTDGPGAWTVCSPLTVRTYTGVGYFFAREISAKLDVPVGLIHAAWGGTEAEAWISGAALEKEAEFKPILEDFAKKIADYPRAQKEYEEKLGRWTASNKAGAPPALPIGRESQHSPAGLFNGMISPLIPFSIRGVLWYQGEANRGRAVAYRTLFPSLIHDWRRVWDRNDMPFLFVQLANIGPLLAQPKDSNWALLREAQRMALSVPHTGMAVAIDLGGVEMTHPTNKQDVGLRLALIALGGVYGKDVAYSSPLYESMSTDGNIIRLKFDKAGLVVKGAKLEGFAIAGTDRRFVWGDAKLVGETVEVSSPEVAAPVAVRYGWADNPTCNLYSDGGLPASPFRTDDW